MSRRRRSSIVAAVIVLVAAGLWLSHTRVAHSPPGNYGSQLQRQSYDLGKYHGKTFTIVRIVDGDTIDIDAANGRYESTRIRLWGVDTPEVEGPRTQEMYFGPQATCFTRELVLGNQVRIYLDADNRTRDKYDRLLAYVQLPDGRFLNELLLSEGFAYADTRFRHSFYSRYKQLQASARRAKKGLWAQVTREQLPDWLQRAQPKLLADR
jgi:micrococcal nuclease